ncbi:MAG: response regulator [Anaerolineae bacterium]|nr:response regulator [Anaerolineae bacterium]
MKVKRVLILDDDEGNRMLLAVALGSRGIETAVASDGTEALALIECQAFDVALLDVNLPDIDGLEVARRIRAADDAMVIAIVTTDDEGVRINESRASGSDVFIAKPFELDTLFDFIEKLDPAAVRKNPELLVIDNARIGERF